VTASVSQQQSSETLALLHELRGLATATVVRLPPGGIAPGSSLAVRCGGGPLRADVADVGAVGGGQRLVGVPSRRRSWQARAGRHLSVTAPRQTRSDAQEW
jgi:hypothetical protein